APQVKLPPFEGRIVGGDDADIKDYPYQLSLLLHDRHFCGASIIGEKWVLTAGHCVESMEPQDLTVRAGSSIINDGGQVIQVKAYYRHPKFSYQTIDYDMALLELQEPIKFNDFASPIKLVEANSKVVNGEQATISGWGTTFENAHVLPQHLQAARVDIISIAQCRMFYGDDVISDRMLCAGYPEGGVDSCQGDSGGPLVVDGKLAGIVSWGYGCAEPRLPGIYSDIGSMRDFVTEISGI
ncbi:hypothetical protein NQ317_004281, partial [Molorchus minor]